MLEVAFGFLLILALSKVAVSHFRVMLHHLVLLSNLCLRHHNIRACICAMMKPRLVICTLVCNFYYKILA